jgi:hypothetical protein
VPFMWLAKDASGTKCFAGRFPASLAVEGLLLLGRGRTSLQIISNRGFSL